MNKTMNKEFGYYKFIVECYNASTNATDTEKGIVAAKSYTKATKRIINYYGEDLVSLSLYGLEPNSIFLISSTDPLCNETSPLGDKVLENVPSAEPEIIRCRNCKFASGDSRICMKFGHSPIGELDFCAWAERRTDE